MRYQVDSNVLVDVLRGSLDAVTYLNSLKQPWGLSQATAMELIVGSRSKRHTAEIHKFLSDYPTVPFSGQIGDLAYRLVYRYAKSHGLHVFDALIAATTMDGDFVLVSLNRKHYGMIEDLKLQVPRY